MKKQLIWSLALLATLMACKKQDAPQTQSDSSFKFPVKVVTAAVGSFQKSINYKGTVMAWQTANIMPEVAGRIARIHKQVGEEVRAGDILAELDLTALNLQKKQAEAGVSVAEKGLSDARLNQERMTRLFEKNAVSSFQLEKSKLAFVAAETQVDSARASLDMILYNIGKSHMKAPFAGIVSARRVDVGDMVNPMMGSDRAVMELLDLSRVKVIVDLTAEDIEKISLGQPCRVRVSGNEQEFSGEVFSKSLSADTGSKSFRVEIAVPNQDQTIRANVFAEVWIEIEKLEDVLVLPLPALLLDRYLMVVENGRARKIEVQKGVSNADVFVVSAGLKAGQVVIVEGNYDLQDGQEVTF
jgi:membrane fusion protein (multidrug efflux system)